MQRLVIRHGEAEKGEDPAITPGARTMAVLLRGNLHKQGIPTRRIAVADSLRARQTAKAIGGVGSTITIYDSLNEVPNELPNEELKQRLKKGNIPEEALTAAELLLSNPPVERIYVSHGLLLAGLQAILAMRLGEKPLGQNMRLDNLETRKLDF